MTNETRQLKVGRLLSQTCLGAGAILFVAAFVWPAAALVWRAFGEGLSSDSSIVPTLRQWGLLWRSVWMAATAACLGTLLAIPAAAALKSLDQSRWRLVAWACAAACVLCPSTVLAFGWERLLGAARIEASVRCVALWVLWCWPLAAFVVRAGWPAIRECSAEAALLEAPPVRVFWHITLPGLRRPVGLSLMVLFVVFLTDYGVPHACGLAVYATELLGWAASSSRIVDTLWPAVPGVAIPLLVLWSIVRATGEAGKKWEIGESEGTCTPRSRSRVRLFASLLLWVVLLSVSLVAPVAALAIRNDLSVSLISAWTTYRVDLFWTLATAVVAAIASTWMGLAFSRFGRFGGACVTWALGFGAIPGALIGLSLVAAYNRQMFAPMFDHWPIVALALLARFGWVGAVAGFLSGRSVGERLAEQAQTDGATPHQFLLHIRIPLLLPTLVASSILIVALSVGDIAATSLVRAPGFSPISLVLLEKFHRFEDGMLVALSLWLVGLNTVGATVATLFASRRSGQPIG